MGKFEKYKIDLRGMSADSMTFEFVLDNQYFMDIDAPEVQRGKINASVLVKKTSRSFNLDFHLDGVVYVPCDRCLDDVEQIIASTETLVVKLGTEYAEEGDNLIIVPEEDGTINVAWFMYEFIALAIPMKHVHAPGKCNKLMESKLNGLTVSDENEEEMSVSSGEDSPKDENAIDPRWNELKKILDNN